MNRRAFLLGLGSAALLPACGGGIRRSRPEPLYGERWETGLGLPFWWFAGYGAHQDPADFSVEIDEAFEEYARHAYPLFTRDGLLLVFRDYDIQVVPDDHVIGDDSSRGYAGFCWGIHQVIEISLGGVIEDDRFGERSGAGILLHEWEHVTFGAWHA